MIDPAIDWDRQMQKRRRDLTIHRTSNPDCPACQAGRIHQPDEWTKFHPEAGSGIFEGRRMPNMKPQ